MDDSFPEAPGTFALRVDDEILPISYRDMRNLDEEKFLNGGPFGHDAEFEFQLPESVCH